MEIQDNQPEQKLEKQIGPQKDPTSPKSFTLADPIKLFLLVGIIGCCVCHYLLSNGNLIPTGNFFMDAINTFSIILVAMVIFMLSYFISFSIYLAIKWY